MSDKVYGIRQKSQTKCRGSKQSQTKCKGSKQSQTKCKEDNKFR